MTQHTPHLSSDNAKLFNIASFASTFEGEIILPGDDTYEQASTTFVVKGSPALVVRPRTAGDVARAVQYATENSLLVSVRSGGHSGAGFSTNNGGIVIDLSHFKAVKITDAKTHTVQIGSGATWGEVAEELQKHGLAISSGDTATVGVGGLTLGGGIGWMVRKYGLAIDSLVAAEVVTANGAILQASATENADLFWALRGGGGNFGIVTTFTFTAHPISRVYAGKISYPVANLASLLKGWRDHMRTAPDELTTTFLIMPSFAGKPPAAIILCCYASDDHAAAMRAIEPLQHLGETTHIDITQKDYADILEQAHPPSGVKVIVHDIFAQHFSDELIDTICENQGQILQIRSIGGAANRVAADATAFAHRNSEVLIVSPTFVPPQSTAAEIAKALEPWHRIAACGQGSYANLLSECTPQTTAACYPDATYQRLVEVKTSYDPRNIFNQNYNIEPSHV